MVGTAPWLSRYSCLGYQGAISSFYPLSKHRARGWAIWLVSLGWTRAIAELMAYQAIKIVQTEIQTQPPPNEAASLLWPLGAA